MNFGARIRSISSGLRQLNRGAALLLSTAPFKTRNRDSSYPYRQSSDFYYLTGSASPRMALLVTNRSRKPFLLAKKQDAHTLLWEGPSESPKAIAKAIGAELVVTEDLGAAIRERLKGVHTLYHDNSAGTLAAQIARCYQELPSHQRKESPQIFVHSDALLEPMRLKKDPQELKAIAHAIEVTHNALQFTLGYIRPGIKEYDVANLFEYGVRSQCCDIAFSTIVATGPSAAILHYEPMTLELRRHQKTRELKRSELFMIDCGAESELYAADITRTFPVSGEFSGYGEAIYSIVLAANEAAIAKVRSGVLVRDVYNAAAKIMIEGLKELGLLRGRSSELLAKEKHKEFFPHGIGHSLGLDVHDLSSHRGSKDAVLEEGMVFTIEPGLYLPKRRGKIPACGVRIEDDILVTKKGCTVLTAEVPKEIEDVERWMAEAAAGG